MTDGYLDNDLGAWHQSYVNRLNGIHTMVIGLPTNIGTNPATLDALSSWPPSANTWTSLSFDRLKELVPEVREAVCNGKDLNV
jgi:hypothetical protein